MERKVVSGITLTLLLFISILTSALNIQPAKANPNTTATIIEHKITTLELQRLIQKIGVSEEGKNYNQIINGHGTGLRPPTYNEWTEIADKTYIAEKILFGQPPPSSIDHSTEPWFPPIGDQGGEGSCTAWAVGYYTKTYQEAKERAWNLTEAEWDPLWGEPTPEYQNRIISPDFLYHLTNGGIDAGSSFYDAITLVCTIGASSWQRMPYKMYDSTSWPSEAAWREAPLYRGNSSGYEIIEFNTDEDITSLKNWLASGCLAVVAVDANQYSKLTSNDIWTYDKYTFPIVNHANTIIGYDDTIGYMEEGQSRQGAFKIANSWGVGTGWENIADGCYWISYKAMKLRVGYCMFYRDRIGYDPKLVTSFEIDHSQRGKCDVFIGMGNHTNPLAAKWFSNLVDGGSQPFCPNNIVLDITEFEDAVPTLVDQSFFMRTRAGIPLPHSGTHEWYSGGTSYSWFRLTQAFDIPETGATLKFWNYFEIEEDWDYGYVEVHDLDTNEWYTLPGLMTVSTLPERQDNINCPPAFEPTTYYDLGRWNAFTGFSGVSYEEEMDLTPFANHTITLRFTYWTDPYALELGWYIDDIQIPEIGFFDDVESGVNGWTYNGWSISTPPTSPTGTLLSFAIEYYQNYTEGTLNAKSTSHDVPATITNQDIFAELILKNLWTVDDDGSADFNTIQEAINEAIDGNTILVYGGTYYENVVLNKSLSLIGENKGNTIVDGSYTANVMNVTSNNVNIIGFTIRNSGSSSNCGIYISSSGNNISYNIIANSTRGVYLSLASDNTFFHNAFINNTLQVYVQTPGYVNFWDNGCEGNYWSDYGGIDSDGDGIGDTPYSIDADNQDNYPLMSPYMVGDINHDGIVDICDLAAVGKAYGSKPGDSNWNLHCDITGSTENPPGSGLYPPDGIVDIYGLATIGKNYGKTI